MKVIEKLKWVVEKLVKELKGLNQSQRHFAMRSRDEQRLSERPPNAANKDKCIQRAANR